MDHSAIGRNTGRNTEGSSSDDDDNDLRLYGTMQDTTSDLPKVRPGTLDGDDEMLDKHGGNKSTSHLLPSQKYAPQGSQNSTGTHVVTRSYSESMSKDIRSFDIKGSNFYHWYHHPKVQENWKVVVGSFLLTVVGLILCLVGVGILISPDRGLHCLVFFIGGLLCLIPGAYHLVYIYLAVKGFNGYSLYNLPVFS